MIERVKDLWQNRKMVISVGKLKIDIMWVMLALLIFIPDIWRLRYLNDWIKSFHVFTWACVVYMFNRDTTLSKKNIKLLAAGMGVMTILFVYTRVEYGASFSSSMKFYLSYMLPIVILYMEFSSKEQTMRYLRAWYYVNYAAVLVMVIGGLIDKVTDRSVSAYFTEIYATEALQKAFVDNRTISYIGNPLWMAFLTISLFAVSTIVHEYKVIKGSELMTMLICFLSTALSGGKTILVLMLFGAVAINCRKGRLKYLTFFIVCGMLLYLTGFLDNVINRLAVGIKLGDITTGRNSSIRELIAADEFEFFWLRGHLTIEGIMVWALEYPVLRLAYRHGIVFALLFTIMVFGVPFIKMLRQKKYLITFLWLLAVADINTFSDIASACDATLTFALFTMLCLNLPSKAELAAVAPEPAE